MVYAKVGSLNKATQFWVSDCHVHASWLLWVASSASPLSVLGCFLGESFFI